MKVVSWDEFVFFVTHPSGIVPRALIVGVLIAICASLLGVTLVLKRFSFVGDGLSRVAFGAAAIAAAFKLVDSGFLLSIPVTVIFAIVLLHTRQSARVKGDAAVAMISVGAMGIGYLIMSIFPSSANASSDVCTVLFGSYKILAITTVELWVSMVASVLVVGVFLLFYNKIFAVTFDEDFSTATGVRARMYNLMLSVVIAIVIVLAMSLVGALLISALIIFPAMSAMSVFKSFRAVVICALVFTVVCTVLGILVSLWISTPVGSTIVAIDIAGFLIFSLTGFTLRRGFAK